MKQWPKNKRELVPIEDLLEPLKRSLLQAYKVERTENESVPYDGYCTAEEELGVSFSPEENITESSIAYHKERGRDVMDIILLIAFQLGMEQGRRSISNEPRI